MKYTEEQLRFLRKNRTLQRKELTDVFNQVFNSNKSLKAINSLYARYNFNTGRTGQFVKGLKPWNKGLKSLQEAWNKSAKQTFINSYDMQLQLAI